MMLVPYIARATSGWAPPVLDPGKQRALRTYRVHMGYMSGNASAVRVAIHTFTHSSSFFFFFFLLFHPAIIKSLLA